MKQGAERRREVKTRLTDAAYEELQFHKAANGFDSDSAALASIVEKHLLGANYLLRTALRRNGELA